MADPISTSIRIRDGGGKTTNANLYFDPATTLAAVQAYVTDYLPVLDAVTGGVIDRAELTLPLSIAGTTPALKAVAEADVIVANGFNLGFTQADTSNRWTQRVPAVKTALYAEYTLNTTDPLVVAYVNALVGGLGGLEPQSNRGNDILSFLGASFSGRKV